MNRMNQSQRALAPLAKIDVSQISRKAAAADERLWEYQERVG
jgi:hypothetical protein